jgi:hypothetical protein
VKLDRVSLVGALAAITLTGFGCGSDESRNESQLIPSELAEDLARQSDSVRTTLAQGDECTAKGQARALRSDVRDAINEGKVPPRLRSELRRRAERLLASIDCARPPQPPPPPVPTHTDDDDEEDDDHGEKRGKGKKGDRGREDD